MHWLVASLLILAAYLSGAIPFGYLVARARGVNIFEHGSGNTGATNVGRVLGPLYGFLVFALDCAKGAAPVALAMLVKTRFVHEQLISRGHVEVAAALAAFAGHMFPVYLGFRGGKGVATGLGAVFVLLPIPAVAAVGAWIVVVCATRYVSAASIAAVLVLSAAHLRQPTNWSWSEPRTLFCALAGLLVILRHHANIVRLCHGTENQLKERPAMQQLTRSLHTIALGLWFGMAVFFTFVVAFSLFSTFEAASDQDPRESWFPRPALYRGGRDNVDASKEQGARAAGHAIAPMFVWYFALQGACGFVALATALPWLKSSPLSRLHRWRVNLLLAGVLCVMIGWPLERRVSELRGPRIEAMEIYLNDRVDAEKLAAMKSAHAEFMTWHTFAVIANLVTILCVAGAMALAGNLESPLDPARRPASKPDVDDDTVKIETNALREEGIKEI